MWQLLSLYYLFHIFLIVDVFLISANLLMKWWPPYLTVIPLFYLVPAVWVIRLGRRQATQQ